MRNPIRLKNLNLRYFPLYLLGVCIVVLYPTTPFRLVLSLPFFLVGLAIRSWGAGHLVKNDRLTLSGPYAHLRHPLYAGTILIATGLCLLIGGWIGAILLAATLPWFALRYFPRKERIESERLEALHGQAYVEYRNSVPALWPLFERWYPNGPRAEASSASWRLDRYSDNNELGTVLAVVLGVCLIGVRSLWT